MVYLTMEGLPWILVFRTASRGVALEYESKLEINVKGESLEMAQAVRRIAYERVSTDCVWHESRVEARKVSGL